VPHLKLISELLATKNSYLKFIFTMFKLYFSQLFDHFLSTYIGKGLALLITKKYILIGFTDF